MLDALVFTASEAGGRGRAEAELQLRGMVLSSVTSPHTQLNYSKALNLLFALAAGRPFTRALLSEYRTSMEGLTPSAVNVRLAAVRKLVEEARRNGLLTSEVAANLTDVPYVRQRGTRLGNWLTKEQARELLQVPDCSTLKGKRDYAILSLLINCGLRRMELSKLQVEDLQMRENRWVLADIRGKGNRVRTVAVSISSKQAVNAWQTAVGIEEGHSSGPSARTARSARDFRTGRFGISSLRRLRRSASSGLGLTICGAPARSSAGRLAATWSRSSSCWATAPSR